MHVQLHLDVALPTAHLHSLVELAADVDLGLPASALGDEGFVHLGLGPAHEELVFWELEDLGVQLKEGACVLGCVGLVEEGVHAVGGHGRTQG